MKLKMKKCVFSCLGLRCERGRCLEEGRRSVIDLGIYNISFAELKLKLT